MGDAYMEKFLDCLTEDEDLRSFFLMQNSIDGAYEVAKPFLDEDMTKDKFSKEMTGLARNIIESGELSDDKLSNVAGGVMIAPWKVIGACEDPKRFQAK